MNNILFLILFLLYTQVYCKCESKKTCDDCIKDNEHCVWCAAENFPKENNRCMPYPSDLNWCSNNTINPTSSIEITENSDFMSDFGNIVQMKPQKGKINIRPGQTVDFNLSFKKAKNYPVDMYFLIDGSMSMETIKDNIVNNTEEIYKMMSKITNNVNLGMGQFVDKNALPFTQSKNSTLAYSFKQQLKLSEDVEKFQKIVKDSKFGLNYDDQEGTLDALAQVLACKEEIGWRNESRRIVVVFTDAPYHAVGDGKWAGIVRPYDGKCYMKNDVYTKELEMDYPSLSIINRLASDEQVSVIFAITDNVMLIYRSLSKAIAGSKYATYDGNEMPLILSSIYENISNNIKLKVNMDWQYEKFIKISFDPDCYETPADNIDCIVKQDDEINISGRIELLKYFSENITIEITIEGIREKLLFDISTIGTCSCKDEIDSKACSKGGMNRCGICICNKNRRGDTCECETNSIDNINNNSTCIMPNSTDICNRLGTCICGVCMCREGYSGQFCDCNMKSCPRDEQGDLCSNLGDCECGTCRCNPGWTGNKCNCPISTDTCLVNDKVCNDRGSCVCGTCKCKQIAKWDTRANQDELCVVEPCETCHIPQCGALTRCVTCLLSNDHCSDCGHMNLTKQSNVTDLEGWMVCSNINVDLGCYTKFVYRYSLDQYGVDVIAQSSANCADSYYMLGGGCLLIVVLIGLITLVIWKLITRAQDRAEYESFLENAAKADGEYDNNDVYETPTTTFENPAYGMHH